MGHRSKAHPKGKILSPILELPEGSRTPTPVKDTGCGKISDTCKRGDRKKDIVKSDTADQQMESYLKLRSEICAKEDSFLDYVMAQADGLADQMERKGKELRQEQKMAAEAERNLEYYKKELQKSKLSWTQTQVDKYELQTRLLKLDSLEKERNDFEEKLRQWEAKKEAKKSYYSLTVEDNRAVRKMLSDVTGVALPECGKLPKIKDLDKKSSLVPRTPKPTRSGSKRPYTGKSRAGQTTKLPDIADNNSVASSPRLPPVTNSVASMYPTPPASTCKSSAVQIEIKPLKVLPPIRGASSLGDVPVAPKANHTGPKRRLDWFRKRFN